MANEKSQTLSLFQLCLNAASTAGVDPLFNMSLLIDSIRHTATGVVEMKQKTQPPSVRFDVTGTFHELLCAAQPMHVITLKGGYVIPFPPPQIGEILVPFSATILLDDKWSGRGTFHYGSHQVEQAIVNRVDCVYNRK